jgi:uncharacterized protein
MEYKKPLTFILVKPSGPDCNLACKYCFYTKKRDYFGNDIIHRMDKETLELLIKKSLNRPHKQISFGWQGGEPTLMGLDFYKDVVELQKKYGSNMVVSNSLQTNGILLDEKWVEFLKEYSFLVGLSIDGPREIHDSYRVDQGGKPTHQKVEKVAKMLLNSGVEVNALSVVTEKSSKNAKLLYNYLKDLGFKFMQFIPIMEMDPNNPKEVADFSVTAHSYGKFLCDLFDVWVNDFVNGKPEISIRLFETFAAIYLGHEALECTFQKECGKYITVEHNGTIYSCDFFVEDTWLLGSLDNEKSLEKILNSRKQTLFGEVKRKLDKRCLKCKWLKFCYGGCPKDRLRNPATKRFNPFCESIKMFFEHADNQFIEIIKQYK